MVGVFVAFIRVVYWRMIYMSLPVYHFESKVTCNDFYNASYSGRTTSSYIYLFTYLK